MKTRFDPITAWLAVASLACLVVLSGCGPQDGSLPAMNQQVRTDAPRPASATPMVSFYLGEVRHIETLTEREPAAKGVGYRIEVRMDNGDVRQFQRTELDGLRVGRRVRVDGMQLTPA